MLGCDYYRTVFLKAREMENRLVLDGKGALSTTEVAVALNAVEVQH